MSRQAHCLSCGRPLSRYAAHCPRCGAPQPHKRIGSTIGLGLMLLLLAALLLWVLVGDGSLRYGKDEEDVSSRYVFKVM